MYLEKIIMTDFMPYIGTQEVDFTVDENAPIILIEGENNRGKSSLFAAIRWSLARFRVARLFAPTRYAPRTL